MKSYRWQVGGIWFLLFDWSVNNATILYQEKHPKFVNAVAKTVLFQQLSEIIHSLQAISPAIDPADDEAQFQVLFLRSLSLSMNCNGTNAVNCNRRFSAVGRQPPPGASAAWLSKRVRTPTRATFWPTRIREEPAWCTIQEGS